MGDHDRMTNLTFKMAAMWKQKDRWIQKTKKNSMKLKKTKKWYVTISLIERIVVKSRDRERGREIGSLVLVLVVGF